LKAAAELIRWYFRLGKSKRTLNAIKKGYIMVAVKENDVKASGLAFMLENGIVTKVRDTENKNGKPVSYVTVDYLGGSLNFMVDPISQSVLLDDCHMYEGKAVSIYGSLHYSVHERFGKDVRFDLLKVNPASS